MSMRIVLNPFDGKLNQLRQIYTKAFAAAEELCIASAYLTDWDAGRKLGSKCKDVTFLVGTDFGLTRKAALRNVLHWMPTKITSFFGVVPQRFSAGFHPKLMAWRTASNKYFCLIGSSNLSKAGFSGNHEANVFLEITSGEFKNIRDWLNEIVDLTIPVTEDWIEHHYQEAQRKSNARLPHEIFEHVKLRLPNTAACRREVLDRRRQQGAFKDIQVELLSAARRCVRGKITSATFWRVFCDLWWSHDSRFQGSGLQFSGSTADWQQTCQSLINILDKVPTLSKPQLDHLVSVEIDGLKKRKNPTRGAWLTEMLCHYHPDLFPIMNKPIKAWLVKKKWRARPSNSEGQRYIQLAQQLRFAVQERPSGATNLAELDAAIWRWVHDKNLIPKKGHKG